MIYKFAIFRIDNSTADIWRDLCRDVQWQNVRVIRPTLYYHHGIYHAEIAFEDIEDILFFKLKYSEIISII